MRRLIQSIVLFLSCVLVFGQDGFYTRLADSAFVLTKQQVSYDPSYYRLDYPNGDVPARLPRICSLTIRLSGTMFIPGIDEHI